MAGLGHGPQGWAVAAAARIRPLLWLKAIGITLFMWVFFVGYFHVLRQPASSTFEMPLTALDRAVTFQPAALGPYLSLWFYVGIPVFLQVSFRPLAEFGAWAAGLCLVGLTIFYFVPTAVPPSPVPDLSDHPGFALLQGIDAGGNACPSLHVASAGFCASWIDRLLVELSAPQRWRAVNALWVLLIAYSTLATKQHVALDVVGGALLGGAFAALSLHLRGHPPRAETL